MNKKVSVKCQFIPGTIMSPTMKSGIRFNVEFPEWIRISNVEDMRFNVSEKQQMRISVLDQNLYISLMKKNMMN